MGAASVDNSNLDVVLEEIERTVSRAREMHAVVWVKDTAGRIAQTCPGSGLSPQQIAKTLIQKAIDAGVAMELPADDDSIPHASTASSESNSVLDVPSSQSLARHLLHKAIEHIISEAKANSETLRVGYHAGMLAESHPNAFFSIGRIIDEIILAASKAGVAVEIDRPP